MNAQFLAWLRREPRLPLRRLAPLHGAARSLHAAAATCGRRRRAGIRPAIADGWVLDVARRLGKQDAPPLDGGGGRLPARASTTARSALGRARSRRCSPSLERARRARLDRRSSSPSDHGEEFLEHGRLTHGDAALRRDDPRAARHRGAGHRRRAARPIRCRASTSSRRWRALLGARDAGRAPGRDLLGGATRDRAFRRRCAARARRVAHRAPRGPHGTGGSSSNAGPRPDRALRPGARSRRAREPVGAAPEGAGAGGAARRLRASAPPPPRARTAMRGLHEKLRALGYAE